MIKRIIYFVLFCFLLQACKNGVEQKVNVEGTVKNMGDGQIYFIKSSDEKIIDTIEVKQDKFSYSTNIQEPTVYMINFGESQQPGFVILENGDFSIFYEMNNVNSLQIKGGKEQKVYNEFIAQCQPAFKKIDSLSNELSIHEQNETKVAEIQGSFEILDQQLKEVQQTFIKKNPSGIATAFIATNYFTEKQDKTLQDIEPVYNALETKTKETYYGKKLEGMLRMIKETSVGAMAPNFSLPNQDGKEINLSSFKGKTVLIDFWASWCGPCRAENPTVVAAYKKYHDKGFDILGVSLDSQQPQWISAISKDNLTWTQVSDLKGWGSKVAEQYGVQSIPTNFLLDQEGKIIAKDLRGEELTNKLKELLN